MSDEEKRRLRAIQDEIRRTGEPRTAEDVDALFQRMKSIATGGRVDAELKAKQDLADALAKWRKAP